MGEWTLAPSFCAVSSLFSSARPAERMIINTLYKHKHSSSQFPQVKSTQVFIRDSSMVHPVALICLSGKGVREIHHGMYGHFCNITIESAVEEP